MSEAASGQGAVPGQPETVAFTREGYEALQQQRTFLEQVARPRLYQQAQRAALYLPPPVGASVASVARHDLEQVEAQIAALGLLLRDAKVVDPPAGTETVEIGTLVTVRHEDGSEETLALVGPTEAVAPGRVASTSPMGTALLGKRSGDTATASVDKDSITVQIASVKLPAATTDAAQAGAE